MTMRAGRPGRHARTFHLAFHGGLPAVLAMTAPLLLARCGSPPPPPAPTVATLTLTASADVNPTQSGQGAPLIVRVYQLSGTAAFEKAEFFRLLNGDAATLGQDLVKRDEYLLAPGTKKQVALTVPDTVQALGVFAAYRVFQSLPWHATIPLPPHKATPVTVTLSAAGLHTGSAP